MLVGGRLRRPQTKMGISSGPMTYCHTRLHLGFEAMLKIWQVPACKMEPQRGIIIYRNTFPPAPAPTPARTYPPAALL